jgi:hypothetical protein
MLPPELDGMAAATMAGRPIPAPTAKPPGYGQGAMQHADGPLFGGKWGVAAHLAHKSPPFIEHLLQLRAVVSAVQAALEESKFGERGSGGGAAEGAATAMTATMRGACGDLEEGLLGMERVMDSVRLMTEGRAMPLAQASGPAECAPSEPAPALPRLPGAPVSRAPTPESLGGSSEGGAPSDQKEGAGIGVKSLRREQRRWAAQAGCFQSLLKRLESVFVKLAGSLDSVEPHV